ncbi:AfsR/SARP family transcriptional regulator [Streptomyces roseolilacinus]|uniref:SARP family transcriptional regulator n=1 Tax=Streptomyces roseolilacinus TaxID=66904 RepID=A0A918B315_9ACTN|nr:tetratricopeptide repeat protein [Streptomyces roseolilacinus]GGQ18770.1 SARP family transcriptional regulator [Streptomyces roseolilacinus]
MDIHILGPVGLGFRGGRLGLGSDKERLLLTALALDVGRPVALDALVERLWDTGPAPARARENVHTYVSRIRRAIRSAAGPDGPAAALTYRTHTYTLRVPPEAVDWHRYLRLADRARTASAEGDDVRAAELMRRAEQLWVGEALAGLPGLWAERVRAGLSERRRGIATARIAIELRLGRFAEAAAELSPLVDEHPGDETLVGQLMVALYGSGRHADALLAHQALRRRLREDFGTEPGEELARIHRHVLARGPVGELTGSTARASSPAPAPGAAPHPLRNQLPYQAALIGRHDEMRRILAAIDTAGTHGSTVSLESISGMAGVGKTALAVRAAHEFGDRFPDGQLYVNLRAHAQGLEPLSAGAALATLLRLLDVPPQSIPADVEERATLWRRVLGQRRVLIVLDDAAGPRQVRPLLPGEGSECFTIVTSRRSLVGLPQARTLALDVLPPRDAITLFREVVGPDRCGDEAEVARIVELCGHLPLAIEIAANRLNTHPSWDLAVLRERLARTPSRLGEIRDGYSEIGRAFEMSYQALSAAEQATFRMLGLHVGPEFGPHAAAALCGRPVEEVERVLESLLQCHLLQEPAPHRFRFHDLLGEYARLLCAATETAAERDAGVERLLGFYLRTADRCDRVLYPREYRPGAKAALDGTGTPEGPAGAPEEPWVRIDREEEALAWFRAERSNLVNAERHARLRGSAGRAALLSRVLAGFLYGECHWTDAIRMHGAAAGHWRRTGDGGALCRSLLHLTAAHTATGDYAAAEARATEALALSEETGDPDAQGEALRELGVLQWHTGRNQRALGLHRRALELCAASGDGWRQARCHNHIAISLMYLGRYDEALSHYRHAIAGFREGNDERLLAKTLNNLGNLYMHMGNPVLARGTLESGLRIAERTGSRLDLATLQINLAEVLANSGNPRKAVTMYRRALRVFQELGDRKNEAITSAGLGMAHQAMEETERAVAHFQQSLALARGIGAGLEEVQAQRLLGGAELARGNAREAESHLTSAVVSARRIHSPEEEARAEERLAEVYASTGRRAEALELWRHACALLDPLDAGAAGRIRKRMAECGPTAG